MDRMGARASKPHVLGGSLAIITVLMLSRPACAQAPSDANANQAFNGPGNISTTQRAPGYTFGVDVGVGETDNVTLSPSNPISQTMATADTDFSVNRSSRLLDVNASGNFTYLDYLQGAYGNELLGRFDGVADAAIVPGRLVWVLKDDFGQSALDPYTPVTPNNIENINYITTGPDLKFRFEAVDFVDISVRYARAQYQTSPFNSNRFLGDFTLGRDITAGATISINANAERVLFENTVVNTDFNRDSLFGRYELHGSRTDFTAELGATRVDSSGTSPAGGPESPPESTTSGSSVSNPAVLTQPGGSLTGPLAKVQLSRRVSPSAKVILTAGQDITDASSSFSSQSMGATGISNISPAALTSDSYRVTYASGGWQYSRNRTTIGVTGRWERDIYPGLSSLDSTRPSAELNVQRRLTRALTAQVVGTWYKYEYPRALATQEAVGSTDYANMILGASLAWRHGRGLEIRLRYDHDTYSVSNGNTGYHENRIFLTVGYRPAAAPPSEDSPPQ
jgi:hypothetical protein